MLISTVIFLAQDQPAPDSPVAAIKEIAETAVSILGLPVALATAYGTFRVLRRGSTDQELDASNKELDVELKRLEILKNRRDLGLDAEEAITSARQAIVNTQNVLQAAPPRTDVQLLLVRFVILYLLLQFWAVLGQLFQFSAGSIIVTQVGGTILAGVVRVGLVVLFGWPLLLDLLDAVKIPVVQRLRRPWIMYTLLSLGILGVVASSAFYRFF